jgi:hypothetical protein
MACVTAMFLRCGKGLKSRNIFFVGVHDCALAQGSITEQVRGQPVSK